MNTTLEVQLIKIITDDIWMVEILKIVRDLNLNDCWIGAGFVRNKIWDVKHQKKRTALNDIDIIFFNNVKATKEEDLLIENHLKKLKPFINWSVKNQARMHLKNGHHKYTHCFNAISFWPETATTIAVRLNSKNNIEYIAPYGLIDLFNLVVRPTPNFNLNIYNSRIKEKKWKDNWPKLIIEVK